MKPVALRRLTPPAIARFRELLGLLRERMPMPHAPAILFDDTVTERVEGSILVEPRRFATKYDAAVYLRELLRPVAFADQDEGLWSWLTLYWFDQLVPADPAGVRKPRTDVHYIPQQGSSFLYRHLLAGPWRIVAMHGDAAKLLLSGRPHEFGSLLYQVTWRQDLLRNRSLLELLGRLYLNPRSGRPRRGAASGGRDGSIQRLFAVLAQLELNYDLQGMSSAQILALLPPEFEEWR
ncbi:MAG: hypothetical protein ABR524_11370 [Thermoanaerobaculia bacterium]